MSEDWPMSFLGITMIALLKKNQPKKFSNHRTISPNLHTEKIVKNILSERFENKKKRHRKY